MPLRDEALTWLKSIGRSINEPFRVSKYYPANESWTGTPAWWFEFPEILITNSTHSHLNLLCQSSVGVKEFRHLRIPVSFFTEHRGFLGFREPEKKYSLFLSADPQNIFQEVRGEGKIKLADFEVSQMNKIRSAFQMPTPMKVSGRSSSITAAFVTAIVPQLEPTDSEISEALSILGMSPDSMACAYCGGPYTEWDHLRPLVIEQRPTGYFTHIENLVPSCGKCNQSKGNKHWRSWIMSDAKLSPKSRNVADLDTKITRLNKYEEWGNVHPVEFKSFVDPIDWENHWKNWQALVSDMKKAQDHALRLRERIQKGISNKKTT
jgi:hypothetical protein